MPLGHLLYEMSYGQELFDAKPGKLHFEYCSRSVEVGEVCYVNFIFTYRKKLPAVSFRVIEMKTSLR